MDYPMIYIGCERNEAGEPLVRGGGALCGTVEGLKSMIDEFWERETLRKLREKGVALAFQGGEPRINVPACAAGVVVIGNEPAKDVPVYDPRKDPKFHAAVTEAVRDAMHHRVI